jgi:hypothetical protein
MKEQRKLLEVILDELGDTMKMIHDHANEPLKAELPPGLEEKVNLLERQVILFKEMNEQSRRCRRTTSTPPKKNHSTRQKDEERSRFYGKGIITRDSKGQRGRNDIANTQKRAAKRTEKEVQTSWR